MSGRRTARAFVHRKRPLRGPLRKTGTAAWARHPQDWYVEPEWVSERLFAAEKFEGRIVDPACGEGRIVRVARRAGLNADGFDIVSRAAGFRVADFFQMALPVPNLVFNPPFRYAMAFVGHALNLAERKVAALLPAAWVQAETRSRWLARTPLARIWLVTPRPSMPPGHIARANVPRADKRGNGTTDYAWLVWERGHSGLPQIGWLRRNDIAQPSHDCAGDKPAQQLAAADARNARSSQAAARGSGR